jgi:ABC-2 type transport system ATP-binding protein
MSSAIRTYALSKKFRNTVALDRLDLDVPEGAIYGLTGPNGAGKSTCIKLLLKIHRQSGGHSEVLGTDSGRLSPAELAQIGYVPENQEMPEWMTAGYFQNYLSAFYPTWDRALAADLLRQFQLAADGRIKQLSRGMRMKLALASSMAYRPKLIVLDEPFSGLDPLVRDELIESLLARAESTTIFISSHDLAEIESFASHVGYLESGKLQFSEELESLSARFREVVLTFPAAPPEPAEWPRSWLSPERAYGVVRFVEMQFHAERTASEVRRVFPGFRDIAVSAMPLRSIFVTLAKAARAAA